MGTKPKLVMVVSDTPSCDGCYYNGLNSCKRPPDDGKAPYKSCWDDTTYIFKEVRGSTDKTPDPCDTMEVDNWFWPTVAIVFCLGVMAASLFCGLLKHGCGG